MAQSKTLERHEQSTSLAGGDACLEANIAAIKQLYRALPEESRAEVLRELATTASAIPTPRGGPVLGAMAKILALRVQWSVPDIKQQIAELGVEAAPKDIYNAIGYLARRGYVRRVGYGRYVVEGAGLTAAEDFGGEPTRNECE